MGYSFEEMADPSWFERDPEIAWAFYGHRYNLYCQTEPHEGFYYLKRWGQQKPHDYFVITSNVDGHFQKAGFAASRVYEVHGSIHYLQCSQSCQPGIWPANDLEIKIDHAAFRALQPLPTCHNCGAWLRPNILMFGDYHWQSQRADRQAQNLNTWLATIKQDIDIVIIECGAGTAVPTIRSMAERLSSASNITLIRINPRDAEVAEGAISIELPALAALQAIDAIL